MDPNTQTVTNRRGETHTRHPKKATTVVRTIKSDGDRNLDKERYKNQTRQRKMKRACQGIEYDYSSVKSVYNQVENRDGCVGVGEGVGFKQTIKGTSRDGMADRLANSEGNARRLKSVFNDSGRCPSTNVKKDKEVNADRKGFRSVSLDPGCCVAR